MIMYMDIAGAPLLMEQDVAISFLIVRRLLASRAFSGTDGAASAVKARAWNMAKNRVNIIVTGFKRVLRDENSLRNNSVSFVAQSRGRV